MKASELRIGNLIYNQGGGVSRKTLEVSGNTITELSKGHMGKLSPIPLTEEWLVKFGFEFYWMSGMCLIELRIKNDFRVMRGYSSSIDGNIELELRYGPIHVDTIQIEYVHQLQNLYFALTGEELTINEKSPTI